MLELLVYQLLHNPSSMTVQSRWLHEVKFKV